MKRWIRVILLFLVLGAVVNYAVAWGCVARTFWLPHPNTYTAEVAGLNVNAWISGDPPHSPYLALWDDRPTGFTWKPDRRVPHWEHVGVDRAIVKKRHYSTPDVGTGGHFLWHVSVTEAGWPMRAVHGRVWSKTRLFDSGTVLRERRVDGAFNLALPGDPADEFRAIPLIPLWPGLAVNSLIFAVGLWLPICGPFVLRRHRRRRRGRCLNCGYDLCGEYEHGCSECGWKRA